MPLFAGQSGVQDTDVQLVGCRRGIRPSQIVRNVALLEALAVQGDSQLVDDMRFRSGCREHRHVVRQAEAAGDLALGVVIAVDQEGADSRVPQAAHLPHEEHPGLVIPAMFRRRDRPR